MSFLTVEHIVHKYGSNQVLHGCSFSIEKGESLALLGESGSGKTTLLRLIAGFEQPVSGQITLNDRVLATKKSFVIPEKRDIGLVFQDYALFPHLTVHENIALAYNGRSKQGPEEWLTSVGLSGFGQRKPYELSGGQQQRVAIVRALASHPQLLLLDEPFSNIDESLKFTFRYELQKLLDRTGLTSIFVTHDTKDALAVADRIVVLKDGEVRQFGTPEEVYHRPADRYVAGLLAPFNTVAEKEEHLDIIRAEHCHITSPEQGRIKGIVKSTMFQGGHYLANLESDDAHWVVRATEPLTRGTECGVTFDDKHLLTVRNR